MPSFNLLIQTDSRLLESCANEAEKVQRQYRLKGLCSSPWIETFEKRPLSKSALICPISALRSDFNPRNIQYIPVVKILTRLDLERN